MDTEQSLTKDLLHNLFFSIPAVLITIMVLWNPSDSHPVSPFSSGMEAVLLSIIIFSISWTMFFILIRIKKFKVFVAALLCSFILSLTIASFLAYRIHRDYYTMYMQIILIYWILFIRRSVYFHKGFSGRKYVTHLYSFTRTLYFLLMIWLILMAYSVVSRQEPRWAESLVYNAYNMLLSFVLYLSAVYIKIGIYRKVVITGNSISIDDYDFTDSIGSVNIEIIRCLINDKPDRCRCGDIIEFSHREGVFSGGKRNYSCDECIGNNYKVSLCSSYKNIDNRVREIRKLFESLEIGTILYPENKRNILNEGWKLRFFDNVRISVKSNISNRNFKKGKTRKLVSVVS